MTIYRNRHTSTVLQLPDELKAKVKSYKTPKALATATGLSDGTAKKLYNNTDIPVTYATIAKLYGALANDAKWTFYNNIKYIMLHPRSRETYAKLARTIADAVCLVANCVTAKKRSAFTASITHKPLFDAIDAIIRAGRCLWRVHKTWPEYDSVLFGDSKFIETWMKMTGEKDRCVPERSHSVNKTMWQPLMFFNEDPELELTRAHRSDAGWDIKMADEEVTIEPQHSCTVSTGFHIHMPVYHVGFIKSRSGLATKYGIEAGAGVIDQGYRGEIKVLLHNHGPAAVTFHKGDRIAQLVIVRIFTGDCVRVKSLGALGPGDRKDKGFGSSGT